MRSICSITVFSVCTLPVIGGAERLTELFDWADGLLKGNALVQSTPWPKTLAIVRFPGTSPRADIDRLLARKGYRYASLAEACRLARKFSAGGKSLHLTVLGTDCTNADCGPVQIVCENAHTMLRAIVPPFQFSPKAVLAVAR